MAIDLSPPVPHELHISTEKDQVIMETKMTDSDRLAGCRISMDGSEALKVVRALFDAYEVVRKGEG